MAIDGDSLAHRAFHALPKSIRDGAGRPANMLVGFGNMLIGLWESERPRTILAGWDTLDVPTYRNRLFAEYQSGREFPPELREQLDRLPELVEALGFAWGKQSGYEADDFLATAVAGETARGGSSVVVTSDRDMFQLASNAVTLVMPKRGVFEVDRVGPAEVRERYGVEPDQVPDFIALRGDPSDGLPGAKGVGPKSAASLLQKYPTLEDAIADGRFAAQAEELRLFRRIATMDSSAPLPELDDQRPTWDKAAALARHWELRQLATRLGDLAAASTQAGST